MPTTANPYMYNADMKNIAGNLATAIFGDPEARMKRDYYNSEVTKNDAATGKLNQETDRLQTGNQQFNDLPAILQAMQPLPGETPLQTSMRTAPLRGRFLQAYPGSNVKEAADANSSGLANVFAVGGDDDKRTSLVIQGKMPNEDFAGTDAQANVVLNNKGGWKDKTERGVAGIHEAGATSRNNADNSSKEKMFYDTPQKTTPGEDVFFSPTDPRYKSLGPKVSGAPNKATVEGAAGMKIMSGDHGDTLAGLFNGSGGVAKGAPMTLNGKSMQDIVAQALANVPGALDASNPKLPVMASGFQSSLDPAKLQGAYDAAGRVMQQTRDVNKAGEAFRQALGLQPGDSYGSLADGLFGNPITSNKGIVHAQPVAPAAAPVVAPAPAPVASPAQLPPPATRKDGMTINSPKGPVTWSVQTQSWHPVGGGA